MIIAVRRAIRFSLQNVRRNSWLAVLTLSILVLALLSVNVLIVTNLLTRAAIRAVQDRIDVSVYFKPEANSEIVSEAKSYLLSLPEVKSVQYTTAEQALTRLTERHAGSKLIQDSLAEVGSNPLGATLSIKARSPDEYPSIVGALENPTFAPYIADKNFGDHRKIIERIQTIAQKVEFSAAMASATFTLIAALIVFNTIRIAIYTRREEIAIMRLVGASNAFIRTPFLLESLFYSVFATATASLILYPALSASRESVLRFFDNAGIDLYTHFVDQAGAIISLELIGASMLGLAAAALAVGRYLKV